MIPTTKDVRQGWNSFARVYCDILEVPNTQLGLSLARMLRIDSSHNILEAGCGSGVVATQLLQTLPHGIKYTSLDISDEMVKFAQQRKENMTSKFNDVDHTFIQGDAEDLSFLPDESIDLYYAPLCLHLTPDPNKALQEAFRVLRKGGRIGFSVIGSLEQSTLFRIFTDRLREFNITPTGRSMFHLGTKEASIKIAQDNGFLVDFCWSEVVTLNINHEEEALQVLEVPAYKKMFGNLDEEARKKFREAMIDDYRQRLANYEPLQTHNVLVVGRKPE